MKPSSAILCQTLLAALPGLALTAETKATAELVTTVQGTRMTDAQVRQKLKADGYTDIQITARDRDHVEVRATKNGNTEKLAINAITGAVMPDNEND
jgi:hypothetical protein